MEILKQFVSKSSENLLVRSNRTDKYAWNNFFQVDPSVFKILMFEVRRYNTVRNGKKRQLSKIFLFSFQY